MEFINYQNEKYNIKIQLYLLLIQKGLRQGRLSISFANTFFMVASKHRTETHSFEWKHCLVQILQSHQRYAKKWKLFLIKYPKYLSRSYIKRFVCYNLYDSQSAFKFLWRLHYHTSCSYQVHKSCSYRLFSLQELK